MANLQTFEEPNTSKSKRTSIARFSIVLIWRNWAAPRATPPGMKSFF